MRLGVGVWFFAFLIVLAASFAAATLSWISSTDITLTAVSGNASEYQGDAQLGSSFTIPVYSNPIIGFTVTATVDNPNIVKYVGSKPGPDCPADINNGQVYAATVGTINQGCHFIYTFQAVGAGSTTIRMISRQLSADMKTYTTSAYYNALVRVSNPTGTATTTASSAYGSTSVTAASASSVSGGGSGTAVTTAATNVAGTTASGDVTNMQATVGYEFKFVEYANPSTGYNWVVLVDDQKVVAYTGYKEVSCSSQAATSADGSVTASIVGGGCNYAYYFKATAEGTTLITMKYMRSWDSNSIVKVKQIAVTVRPAGATTASSTSPSVTAVPVCKEGEMAYKYCCADGILCKRVCRNGAYAEEKTTSADCVKAVTASTSTAVPMVTAVPVQVITVPPVASGTVEIRMQKGWNLFSVPSIYASLQKTSCTRERVYYYNTAAGKYETSSLKSISGPKAHWFYSAEDCSVAFYEKAAYKKENYNEELKAGWNMVGAPAGDPVKAGKCDAVDTTSSDAYAKCMTAVEYAPVKISDYKGSCSIVAAYSFDTPANSWAKASTLEAKKGYFVKVTEACRMYAPDETTSIPALPE